MDYVLLPCSFSFTPSSDKKVATERRDWMSLTSSLKEAIMVVDLFQQLHDEYITAVESQYFELWYSTDAANVQYDPDADEIPF